MSESKSVRIRNVQRPEGAHIFFTSLLLFYDVDYKDQDEYGWVESNLKREVRGSSTTAVMGLIGGDRSAPLKIAAKSPPPSW